MVSIFKMKVAKEPFEKIATGTKIIEARIFDEKRRCINIGDHIEFFQDGNLNQKVITKVKDLYRYTTFKELFADFPSTNFGGESTVALLQEIHQFYSSEEEHRFGVIGIQIEKE